MSKETKAELIKRLESNQAEKVSVMKKLAVSESETRRLNDDYHREKGNAHSYKKMLTAIRHVVAARLKTEHGLEAGSQYGQPDKKEELPDVLFLRHIMSLADNSPPF